MDRLLILGSRNCSNPLNSKDFDMDLDNTRELHIFVVEQKFQNWNIPKVYSLKIYKKSLGFSNLCIHDYVIETIEKSLLVNPEVEQIELIDDNKLNKFKIKYKFLHIGLVQITIKPLHRMRLDSPILMCLRDRRFNLFIDSLLVLCESNLATGPVYFNCYPNFLLDPYDENISKVLTLNIKNLITMMINSKL